ncbi:MAG: hypothetical protein LBC27_05555 [Spirochaetaceae bacterium]|nr:hypothetical protein [Spirochaetaceae bacterium]
MTNIQKTGLRGICMAGPCVTDFKNNNGKMISPLNRTGLIFLEAKNEILF